MSGDQIRATWFARGGYDSAQVDDLLRRIAAEMDAGYSATPLIEKAMFRKGVASGYDIFAVDWLLGQLQRQSGDQEAAGDGLDPWRDLGMVAQLTNRSRPEPPAGRVRARFADDWRRNSGELQAAWDSFGQLPGLQLRVRNAGIQRRVLVTSDGQIIATGRTRHFQPTVVTVRTGERKYRLSLDARTRSSDPAIAEIAARSIQDTEGHFAQPADMPPLRFSRWRVRVLRDQARMPVLYLTGDPVDRRDRARITFPDRRSLRFLVRGTRRTNAIMTAVDQSGANVARYRLAGATTEIIVNPRVPFSDELVLTVIVSAELLIRYFDISGGGG